ncbi:MAG: RNA degradosome polyphosphate kinase, partial [Desulfofustis sp.]|nr:RNA degradosome polyphosphate kinase [Desulfofustis sp.]
DDQPLQKRLREIIDVQLTNKRSVWEMQPDGNYVKRQPGEKDDPRTVQEIMIDLAEKRLATSPFAKKNRIRSVKKGKRQKK